MQTWKKFLPEYEIVILDYAALNQWLEKNFFDDILYQKFSLPKQADAIRCAILKKYGGLWMDCDTILTSGNIASFLKLKSKFILIGSHIAFIVADCKSIILKKWLKQLFFRLQFYKKYSNKSKLTHLILWLKTPRKYGKLVRNLESWDFLGNGILVKILKKLKNKPQEFLSIDREGVNAFPELEKYGEVSSNSYQQFWFYHDFSKEVLRKNNGIILLHNSWTPEKFLKMSEEEFLSQNNTLANVLKILKGNS